MHSTRQNCNKFEGEKGGGRVKKKGIKDPGARFFNAQTWNGWYKTACFYFTTALCALANFHQS